MRGFAVALCWLDIVVAVTEAVNVWPKLLIANDGKDIRLAEPETSDIGDGNAKLGTRVRYHLSTLYENVDYASPFDVSADERKIFFVRHSVRKNGGVTGDKLVAADLDRPKKPPKVLLKNFFPASDGISVDWITKKLYLYDFDAHQIEVLDYGRSADYTKPIMAVLIYKDLFVRSLVVDPLSGYMFWLNADIAAIERAWMDGTHRSTVLRYVVGFPNSLTVDYEESRLYWTIDGGEIWSATLDGKDVRQVIAGLRRPYAVATFENMLLWGEIFENQSGIYYCEKNSCNQREQLLEKLKPYTLRIFDTRRQPARSNPCAVNNGNCSHLCLLTPGAPLQRSCVCPVGVKMSIDGVTCNDGPEEIIVTAQRSSIRIISLDTLDFTDRRIPVDKIKHAVSVDYDPFEGYLYWLDTELEMIRRVKLDGSGEEDVVTGVSGKSEDLAVDWIAKNVYWTDAGTGHIEVARIGLPPARRILVSSEIKKPRAVIVDPPRGYIYWTDLDEQSPRIEKAFLDGSNRMTLVELQPEQWPNGLTLDADSGHIYWADANRDVIERANAADGSERMTLSEDESTHAWGLTILGDFIYWSDQQHRSLKKLSKITGKEKAVLTDQLTDIVGIKGINFKHFPADTNECGVENGGCSHLCLYQPIGRICMCPLGWELAADGRQCLVPEGYLLFTRKSQNDIVIASLSRFPANLDYLRLHNVSQPFSLDFYYKRRYMYFTGLEGKNGVIARACLNGSSLETVVDYGLSMVESLAIDWLSEQIYWSDAGYNHIEMARLNGQSRKIIIWNDAELPGNLAVSPMSGHLYWANTKQSRSTIERTDLDGNNRLAFMSVEGRVSTLALDYATQRLYWANTDTGTITFADLDNTWQSRVLVSEKSMQPYGLTLFGDRLYWADWHKQTIEMCDKITGSNVTILYNNQRLIKSLTAVHALKQQGWNGCSNGEKKCEHLCFAQPHPHLAAFHCGCPTHYTLASDGRTCSPPTTFVLSVQESVLRRFQISEHSVDGPVATLPYKGVWNVVSLKYDPLNRSIYWMEKINRTVTIKRANENEVNKVETVSLLPGANVFDFALDATTQTIFWTTASPVKKISINKFIDGEFKYLGNIVAETEFNPWWIAVDPLRGYLLFIDAQSTYCSIVRCRLDGKDCNKLVNSEDGKLSLLYADLEDGSVFWFNQVRGTIGRISIDGAHYRPDFLTNLNNGVVSLTVLKGRLYFVDAKTKAIMSVDKARGDDKRELEAYKRPLEAKALIAIDDTITKRLATTADTCANVKCAYICYVSSNVSASQTRVKCGCPVGKKLKENINGELECVDGIECLAHQWHCGDGLCIDRRLVCNGFADCVNGGSDENNCTCADGQFTCSSGAVACVGYVKLCDGTKDCLDGSDENEKMCSPGTIGEGKFRNGTNVSNDDIISFNTGWDSTLNVAIYVIAAMGICGVAVAILRCYCDCPCGGGRKRRGLTASTDGTTLELRVLHPLNGELGQPASATTVTTTVEYSATCRVIHHRSADATSSSSSGIGPLPPPLSYDDRPTLTGKSSSSSDTTASTSITQRRGPKNPPPSLVTVTGPSRSPDSADYGREPPGRAHRNRHRYFHDDDGHNSTMGLQWVASADRHPTASRHGRQPASHRNHVYSPPPPYSACVTDFECCPTMRNNDQAMLTKPPGLTEPVQYEADSSMDAATESLLRPRYEDHSNEFESHEPPRVVGRDHPRRRRSSYNHGRRQVSGRRRSSRAGARPPPSSPCSSQASQLENPPPTPHLLTPNDSSCDSCAEGARPERTGKML